MRANGLVYLALVVPSLLASQDSARVVSPGTSVRVRVDPQGLISGRAVASTDSSLTVRTDYGVETIRSAAISGTQVRRGSAKRFAVISGIVGATLGVTASIVFKDFGCQYEGCSESPAIPAGIFFGGAPAAVIGGFIGAFTPRWRDEPRGISVTTPARSRPEPGGLLAAHECAGSPDGSLNVGLTSYGTAAIEGGVVINCQPTRTLYLSGAFVGLPDRSDGIYDTYRTDLRRLSLGAEKFIAGGLRASFSIDGYREQGTRYLYQGSSQPFRKGGLGAGLGFSAARRVGRDFGLKGAFQVHARPDSNRDPEATFFVGFERSARQR